MRTEFLTNVLIFLLCFVYPAYKCFNSVLEDEEEELVDPMHGPRIWWMCGGLALHLYLSPSRASEEKKGILAEYIEYLQDSWVTSWKDDEGITSTAAAAATTVTGVGGIVEAVVAYEQDMPAPLDIFPHGGEEDGWKKAVIQTTGSLSAATDMTMQMCLRRRHLWGMGTYEKKVRSFVESVLPSDSLLGLCGTRGVGKSELLGLVHDYYHPAAAGTGASSYFHHVLLVNAAACSAGLIVTSAQHAIATGLGLKSTKTSMDLDEIDSRATVIFNRLEDKDERVLLLLDDVEEPFDLFDLGLPVSSHKIIYATRSQSVCAQMMHSTYNTIEMRCMGQDDAWNLFQQNAGLGIGIDAHHPQVHRLAKEMAQECRGLPLALRVIGRAMSSKSDVREWRNAHHLLKDKQSKTQEDEGHTYLDILQTQLKESFLVTSVWPQDGSIPKEMRSLEIPAARPDPKRRRRRLRWIMYLVVLFCQLMLSLASRFAGFNRFNRSFHFIFVLVQFLLKIFKF